jgi:hypothetical protein
MKRCLNIPTTDEVLWKNIIDVLGNSVELKEWMSSKTIIGKSLKSKEMVDIIQNKESKITELTKVLNDLEKGLVKVETEQILNHYPSIEVYKSLKKELTKKYHLTKTEIEELRNSLEQIGNDELWFDWIERFSEEVKDRQELSDDLKKDFLKLIVKDIIVEYDHTDKVHVLTINFKIPVILRDGNEGRTQSTRVIVTPPKSGRKPSNQSVPVGNYSTVVNCLPTTLKYSNSKGYSLRLSVQLRSSNLWTPPYSNYQQELFDIITKFYEVDGMNFKQISDWLVENNYLTPRGTTFSQPKCWSIYKKKNRSINRFTREFDHTITNMDIDVVDYIIKE